MLQLLERQVKLLLVLLESILLLFGLVQFGLQTFKSIHACFGLEVSIQLLDHICLTRELNAQALNIVIQFFLQLCFRNYKLFVLSH